MLLEVLLVLMGIVVILLSLLLMVTLRNGSNSGEGVVTVLVVGDIGRSPRMQYHSMSFAKHGYEVQHVGYGGKSIHYIYFTYFLLIFYYSLFCSSIYTHCCYKLMHHTYGAVFVCRVYTAREYVK